MNSAYIGKLMELAEKDKNVIHLLADSGTGYDEIGSEDARRNG